MLVYDENHSPEMIKGRGKHQLPSTPNVSLLRAPPNSPGSRGARAPSPGAPLAPQGWLEWPRHCTPAPAQGEYPGTAGLALHSGTAQLLFGCTHASKASRKVSLSAPVAARFLAQPLWAFTGCCWRALINYHGASRNVKQYLTLVGEIQRKKKKKKSPTITSLVQIEPLLVINWNFPVQV